MKSRLFNGHLFALWIGRSVCCSIGAYRRRTPRGWQRIRVEGQNGPTRHAAIRSFSIGAWFLGARPSACSEICIKRARLRVHVRDGLLLLPCLRPQHDIPQVALSPFPPTSRWQCACNVPIAYSQCACSVFIICS